MLACNITTIYVPLYLFAVHILNPSTILICYVGKYEKTIWIYACLILCFLFTLDNVFIRKVVDLIEGVMIVYYF